MAGDDQEPGRSQNTGVGTGPAGPLEERLEAFLKAVAEECGRRGLSAIVEDDPSAVYVVAGSWSTHLVVREEMEDIPALPKDSGTRPLYDWQRVRPATERVATGRLSAELPEAWEFRGRHRRWRDTSRWRVEAKVPEIAGELAARAALTAEREDEAERRQAARQTEWEAAMAEAANRYCHDVRLAALRSQVTAWRESEGALAYADALEARAAAEPDSERAEAIRAWADWCRAEGSRLDPLPAGPTRPDAAPEPEDLRPYLDRWSPYGPER